MPVSLHGRKGLEVATANHCTTVPCGAGWEGGFSGSLEEKRYSHSSWTGTGEVGHETKAAHDPGARKMWTQIPLGSSHFCHHFSQEPVWAFCPLGHWAREALLVWSLTL